MEKKYIIEEWVAIRNFDQLTKAEKAIVIEELGSEDAYIEMRKIVLSFQEDEEVSPPYAMHKNVMDAFDLQHHRSDQKFIPIQKSKASGAKKVLVYALLAASIIAAVYLILPDQNSGSNLQIAENKSKKVMNSDSATGEQKFKNKLEKSASESNRKLEGESKNDSGVSDLKSSINSKEYRWESKSPKIINENLQSHSSKADKSYTPSKSIAEVEEVADDAGHKSDEQSKDNIAAPPQPVHEFSLDQENENFSGQQQTQGLESMSERKSIPNFTFKVEGFTQNHYTSY